MAAGILAGQRRAQRKRLAYTDSRLYFLGEVSQADTAVRFRIALAEVTPDLPVYREAVPGNIILDRRSNTSGIGPAFRPLFDHSQDRTLFALSQDFGNGLGGSKGGMVASEFPEQINRTATETLATVTNAIRTKVGLSTSYVSLGGGESKREIAPFVLVDNSPRRHVWAFDRKSGAYRDLVLTRILNAAPVPGEEHGSVEGCANDIRWNREIDLVSHSEGPCPDVFALDNAMEDGAPRLRGRPCRIRPARPSPRATSR